VQRTGLPLVKVTIKTKFTLLVTVELFGPDDK
jgi:hypothetical protein